jgi:enoyl-CoA hydratase/carnithine racemase
MLGEDVLLDVTDGIATVTLNQPEKMNALTPGIREGIGEALDEIEARDDARCVVFEGNGKAFCAGGDVGTMSERQDQGGPSGHDYIRRIVEGCEKLVIRIYNFELPTVAAVDGYCLGAGVGIAMANDILLASDRAEFGLVFRNIGLSMDYATSVLVTRAVGPYVAKELTFTGEFVGAEDAEEMGLINHAYPTEEFEDRAGEFVERIADGPTVALHHAARCIDRAHNSSIREAIEREAMAQNVATDTRDHAEGIEAFSEDRDPDFEGL